MTNEKRDLQNDRLFGFRASRRGLLEHPEALDTTSIVRVGDGDFDFTDYKVQTVRTPEGEGRTAFTSFIEFIDRFGEAHQVVIPGRVVDAIVRHRKTLTKKRRSETAKRYANPNAFGNLRDVDEDNDESEDSDT